MTEYSFCHPRKGYGILFRSAHLRHGWAHVLAKMMIRFLSRVISHSRMSHPTLTSAQLCPSGVGEPGRGACVVGQTQSEDKHQVVLGRIANNKLYVPFELVEVVLVEYWLLPAECRLYASVGNNNICKFNGIDTRTTC